MSHSHSCVINAEHRVDLLETVLLWLLIFSPFEVKMMVSNIRGDIHFVKQGPHTLTFKLMTGSEFYSLTAQSDHSQTAEV